MNERLKKDGSTQHNVSLTAPMAAAVRRWLEVNGYKPNVAFKAGLKLLTLMPHEERTKYFEGIEGWEQEFIRQNPPAQPNPADLDPFNRKKPKSPKRSSESVLKRTSLTESHAQDPGAKP